MSFSDSIPADPEKAKQWISRIYWTIVGSTLLFALLLLKLAQLWLPPPLADWFGNITYVAFGFNAKDIAAWACRRMGISRESKHRETILRDPNAAAIPLGEAPALSVGRLDKRGDPRARISREGMERSRWRGGPILVAWRDVEWCTYDTSRDVAGYRHCAHLTLWSASRKSLLHLRLSEKQASQLLPAIRFYLRGEEPEAAAHAL